MQSLGVLFVFLVIPLFSHAQAIEPDSPAGATKSVSESRPAQYPGGIGKFYSWVSRNLQYPESARKNRIEGRVHVEFVVNEDGSIADESVRVLDEEELMRYAYRTNLISDPACKEEAIRLMRACPDWIASVSDGKPVKHKMILPITFKLPH